MCPIITAIIQSLNVESISTERQVLLNKLVSYIQQKIDNQEAIHLNFICTHNSRRSHLSQIWAQTLAHFYKVPNVFSYSGGTQATAMFSKVAETLQHQGFKITQLSKEANPVYIVRYSEAAFPVLAFSKLYDFELNPKQHFAAVMTCTHADENCPFIPDATRISLPYEDPKNFDETPQQTEKYRERSLEIATEMAYVFSKVKIND